MKKLTQKNYFDKDREHISVSQLKDYMKDPSYYKRKHIDKDPKLEFKVTPNVCVGSMVDELLTTPDEEPQYVKKVLKKDDSDEFYRQKEMEDRYVLGATYFDKGMDMVEELKRQPVWTDHIDTAQFQVLLEGELEGLKVCGLADRIDKVDGKLKLIDLKVTNPARNETGIRWHYHCIAMRYFHQLALYQHLYAEMKGIDKEAISCAHVTIANVSAGLNQVKAFNIGQDKLDVAFEEVREALRGIKDGHFDPKLTTWHEVEEI